MSQKQCSVALDVEEEASFAEMESALRLIVNWRNVSATKNLSVEPIQASADVTAISGTITVSF